MNTRMQAEGLRQRVMSAEQAAALIQHGMTVGMSGFTGAGCAKAVPEALAKRMKTAHANGQPFQIRMLTGASTAPELDGILARANGIGMRVPYQSDSTLRNQINAGEVDYLDLHLSHVAQDTWFGFFGPMDIAVVEVAGILPDGRLIPSSSVGNNKTWLGDAKQVILEVNRQQPEKLLGMHDIYYGTALPPHRQPLPLVHPDDRIGQTTFICDPEKIVAIVETDLPDHHAPFTPVDADSQRIAEHVLDFLSHEVAHGRLPENLLPLQSGVGNIANAVLAGLGKSHYRGLTAYAEVIQDEMLHLLKSGVLRMASATSMSLSPEVMQDFLDNIDFYRERIILRSQSISNHPELVRRLGCIAMNGMIEADLYGNVNSTHLMGSRIQNGIGGSGDFARNAFLSLFLTPSIAKGGKISCIVPMVSHVDHTEHDVAVLVTEQGLADLRGLSPKQRARQVIDKCVHPDYRDMLADYFDRACRDSYGKHTPHLLTEAFAWHQRFVDTGSMRKV